MEPDVVGVVLPATGQASGDSQGNTPKTKLCNRVSKDAFERLEPSAGKLACSVLRGQCAGNRVLLPDQDHRAIKRVTRPMLGFKVFRCARIILEGIELMHMIKKGQLDCPEGQVTSAASQFYSLAL